MERVPNPARLRLVQPRQPSLTRIVNRGLLLIALLAGCPLALAQGMLGNPPDSGQESGIGIVSGWHCAAETITVQFDAYDPLEASYGTTRQDTESICGDADNGFAMLWNWNLLGPGQHTVRVFADGEEFDSATFEVNTLGAEFVTGLDLRAELTALDVEKNIEVRWADSRQGFVITEVRERRILRGETVGVEPFEPEPALPEISVEVVGENRRREHERAAEQEGRDEQVEADQFRLHPQPQ